MDAHTFSTASISYAETKDRMYIRRHVEKKITKLVERVNAKASKGDFSSTSMIVPYRFKIIDFLLIKDVVEEQLRSKGANNIRVAGITYPTSNEYVPIPSGFITRVHVEILPA